MRAEVQPQPVSGPVLRGGTRVLLVVALAGLGLIAWRFAVGLGRATAMNDGYPWGLWIAFDVVTGTAFACGGYAMALLVYVLNRGQYHPLVRPALVTSAFGYSMGALSVLLDVGRPWFVWKVPLYFWHWNGNSVLLEVALCIMAYCAVLWIELSPAFLERARSSSIGTVRQIGEALLPVVRKSLVWFIALGMLLPTMHQSSLGSLLLLSGPRLHGLWNTPLLPLLFLLSCIAMGYGAVVIESSLSAGYFGRKRETVMLAGVAVAMVPLLLLFQGLRVVDVVVRGELGALFAFDHFSRMVWIEFVLFTLPLVMLATERQRHSAANLFRAAMLLLLAGTVYRFDVFLVAYQPGEPWSYFPSVAEILITVGLVAGELLGYVMLVRWFPILGGQSSRGRGAAGPAAPPQAAPAL